jgi:hypothetical protein
VWCEEGPPDTFLQQTAGTFLAAMNARLEVHRRQKERDLILAYETGAFSRASKTKPLSHYLNALRTDKGSGAADALIFFNSLKARGVPVSITRVSRS